MNAPAPKFAVGQRVRIESRKEQRHHRVPRYVQGAVGTISSVCSAAVVPEYCSLAATSQSSVPVYVVKLNQTTLWTHYSGSHGDTLEIEIYEHWLTDAGHSLANRPPLETA